MTKLRLGFRYPTTSYHVQLSPSGTSSVPGSFFDNAIEKKAKSEYSEFSCIRVGIPVETPSGHENFPYVALNLKKVSRVRTEIARVSSRGPAGVCTRRARITSDPP